MDQNKIKKMMKHVEDEMAAVSFAEEGQAEAADAFFKRERRVLLALNAGRTDIQSPSKSQGWTLDLVGNWTSFTDGSAVSRTHNRSNEITDIDGGQQGGDPGYDDAGNTVSIQRGHPENDVFAYRYDAWNRLVQVVNTSEDPDLFLAEYGYDGLGRRIYDVVSQRDFYWSEGWQLLSEWDRDHEKTAGE